MKKHTLYRLISLMLIFAVLTAGFAACGKKPSDNEEGTTGIAPVTAEQPTFTAKPGTVTKSETVFVNLNTSGVPQSIVVSDWLHTDKAGVRVEDISDSESIINVKGLELPEINGENIVWNMQSTDLYYRGFGNKELPVDVAVSYTLDGESISPDSLSGKNGKLGIEIDVTNHIYQTVNIDGKDVKIYCPFAVLGGMILSDPNYTDVEVAGGKVIADGAHQAVLFVSLPGMRESLGFDELKLADLFGFSFPEKFSLTANVTDCSVSNMYFAVMPLSALGFGGILPEKLDDVEAILNQITALVNSMYEINAGKLIGILTGNSDNITSLLGIVNDAAALYQKNTALVAAFSEYLTPENTAALSRFLIDMENIDISALAQALADPAVQKLLEDAGSIDFGKYSELLGNPLLKSLFSDMSAVLSDMQTAMPALKAFSDSVSEGELENLIDDINALMPMISGLSEKTKDPEVKQSLNALPQTTEELKKITEELKNNRELVDALGEFATEENINKLTNILSSVQQGDLTAVLTLAGASADIAAVMVPRLEKILKTGSSYTIYSKAPKNMNTAVMFVYQTPGI